VGVVVLQLTGKDLDSFFWLLFADPGQDPLPSSSLKNRLITSFVPFDYDLSCSFTCCGISCDMDHCLLHFPEKRS
jgi:hypothetical protein